MLHAHVVAHAVVFMQEREAFTDGSKLETSNTGALLGTDSHKLLCDCWFSGVMSYTIRNVTFSDLQIYI